MCGPGTSSSSSPQFLDSDLLGHSAGGGAQHSISENHRATRMLVKFELRVLKVPLLTLLSG
jgi:hypothetical protein